LTEARLELVLTTRVQHAVSSLLRSPSLDPRGVDFPHPLPTTRADRPGQGE